MVCPCLIGKRPRFNVLPMRLREGSRNFGASDAAWSESKDRFVCAQRSTECFEQDAIERIGLWIVFGVPLDAKGK
jgi:hypothetical protein